jgi:hypothetical protein
VFLVQDNFLQTLFSICASTRARRLQQRQQQFLHWNKLQSLCFFSKWCPYYWPQRFICQSSWLRIQRSGFDSRRYQIFSELLGLQRGPLSFVSKTEELLGKKSSGFGLETREYGRRGPSCCSRDTLYLQTLALTSSTSGSRSVGIVRSRTQVTELFICHSCYALALISICKAEFWGT